MKVSCRSMRCSGVTRIPSPPRTVGRVNKYAGWREHWARWPGQLLAISGYAGEAPLDIAGSPGTGRDVLVSWLRDQGARSAAAPSQPAPTHPRTGPGAGRVRGAGLPVRPGPVRRQLRTSAGTSTHGTSSGV